MATTTRGRMAAERIAKVMAGKFEPKQETTTGVVVGPTMVMIDGQMFNGADLGASGRSIALVNIGSAGAALYVPARNVSGSGTAIATGATGSGASGTTQPGTSSPFAHYLDDHLGLLSWNKVNKAGSRITDLQNIQHNILTTHTVTGPAYTLIGLRNINEIGLLGINPNGIGIAVTTANGVFNFDLDASADMDWTGEHTHEGVLRSEPFLPGTLWGAPRFGGWKLQADGTGWIESLTANAIALDGNLTLSTNYRIKPHAENAAWDIIATAGGTALLGADTTVPTLQARAKMVTNKLLAVGHTSAPVWADAAPNIYAWRNHTGANMSLATEAQEAGGALLWNAYQVDPRPVVGGLLTVQNTHFAITDNTKRAGALHFAGNGTMSLAYTGANYNSGADLTWLKYMELQPGTVKMYASGTERLTVTSAGIAVAGAVAATIGTFTSYVDVGSDLFVHDDLVVDDSATIDGAVDIGGALGVAGDVTLPSWHLQASTGTLKSISPNAYKAAAAGDMIRGILLDPSNSRIDASNMLADHMIIETLVLEQTAVNLGDILVTKSGGKLKSAATMTNGAPFEIQLEEPVGGPGALMELYDQIEISGRAQYERQPSGTVSAMELWDFAPRAVMSTEGGVSIPIKIRAWVSQVIDPAANRYMVTPVGADNYNSVVFQAGTAVADYGLPGDAWIGLTSRAKKAFIDIGRMQSGLWAGPPITTVRMGDLSGLEIASDGEDGIAGGPGIDAAPGGQYFKLTGTGLRMQNGIVVSTDPTGLAQFCLSSAGVKLRIYEDPTWNTSADPDPLGKDNVLRSALVWTDNPEIPDAHFGALFAYRAAQFFGDTRLGDDYTDIIGLRAIRNAEKHSQGARVRVDVDGVTGLVAQRLINNVESVTLQTSAAPLAEAVIDSPNTNIKSTKVYLSGIPANNYGLAQRALWVDDQGYVRMVI